MYIKINFKIDFVMAVNYNFNNNKMSIPKLKVCWFQYQKPTEPESDSEYEEKRYFTGDDEKKALYILRGIRKQISKFPEECSERRDAIITYTMFAWQKLANFTKSQRKKIFEEVSEYIKPYLVEETLVDINCEDNPEIVKVCDRAKQEYDYLQDFYETSKNWKKIDLVN